jgi:lysophospholipase L1-like esterase
MRALLKLTMVACSMVLGLLVVEYGLLRGALGYHGIVDVEVFEHDDELGWKLRPNVAAVSSALEYAVTVRTDPMALRASGHTDAWRTIPRRVLVSGDSFAFGWGVEGDQMFSARLQDALATRGVPAAVLTAGVPGYSTDQEYLLWRRVGPQLRPEVTVLLLSGNDPPADNVSSVDMSGAIYPKPFFLVTTGGGLELRGVPVPDKQPHPSSRFEPLKARVRPLAAYALARQFNGTVGAPRAPDRGPAPAIPADALSVTGAILAAFNRELRAQGGTLLVVLIPSPAVRDALATICGKEGIAFVDLGPAFAGRPDLNFKYDGHWNARGHQAAANAVVATLSGMLK